MTNAADPHAGQPVLHLGPKPDAARLTAILVHGRGASADDILSLSREFQTTDVAYLAPEAAGHSWYPLSFLAPIPQNEPWLTSALGAIASLITSLSDQGVPADRVALVGFSQGACLSLEFAARNPRRYAAVVGLSGGLIGPPGTPRALPRIARGDAGVPWLQRRRRAHTRGSGAGVSGRAADDEGSGRRSDLSGMGHTVNTDEVAAVRKLLGGQP